ncbi:MAG: DNA primase [Defluviitaleaceae bacterium]|nr:DNA primase [Defluviitaleaceae bacterium]
MEGIFIYSQDVIESLRQANDIVDVISGYTSLKQQGTNHIGLCPFHREKTPSFSVSASRQFFHCFGCGEGGNVISFVMKIENFGFLDAVKFLADRVNFQLPEKSQGSSVDLQEKAKMYEVHTLAAKFYYDNLQSDRGQGAAAYLDERKMLPAIRRKFGLGVSFSGSELTDFLASKGYSLSLLVKAGLAMEGTRGHYDRFRGRLMFPIFDVGGRVIGFGGRILVESSNPDRKEAKYLNSPESPIFDKSRTLYGLNLARLSKMQSYILVEGYMDVIALYQAGIKNVVAALGTSFSEKHAQTLKNYCKEVVILFDADEAGQKAALRAIEHLYAKGIGIKVARLENAKDPDEYIQKFGVDALAVELQKQAINFVDFQIETAKAKYDIEDAPQKVSFLKEVALIISRLKSVIERSTYTHHIATKYGIDPQYLGEEITALTKDPLDLWKPVDKARQKNITPKKGAGYGEAVSHILSTMASDKAFCDKISSHLTSEEFLDPLHSRMFDVIIDFQKNHTDAQQADIITLFEDEASQVTEIFAICPEYEGLQSKTKALLHQIKLVKEKHLESMMYDSNTPEEEKQKYFLETKKWLETHKISL